MKKISLTLIISTLLLASCELDRLPETTFTDTAFWKSEGDLRGACNRLYSEDPSNASERINYLPGFSHDTRSDELVQVSPNKISAGTSWKVESADNANWRDPYRRIYVSNNIIDKSVTVKATEEVKNRWLGEARFFRAYNYFDLVKKYGGVPLILKSFDSTDDSEVTKGRNTREEIIAQCYEDLEFAAKWLPTRKSLPEADWGRVTRSSALGLIARIGLNIGTLIKYHGHEGDSKAHLKKSIDAFELLREEGHSLFPDFQKLFYFDGEGPNNKENIFVKIYGPNGAPTTSHSNSRGMENSVSVTRNIIDLFLYEDGLPREKSPLKPEKEESFNTVLEKRDPRLKMSVFSLGEDAFPGKGSYQPFANQHGYGYSLKKGFMADEWSTTNRESVDKMLIRYGEMLITYAEALYEYNGAITDAQLDMTVNALRARAGFDAKLTNAFVAANNLNMIDEIRRERTVELLDEGFRYDDIIRWKIAEQVLPTYIIGAKFVDSETSKERGNLASRLTDADGKIDGKFVYPEPDMYVIELEKDRSFDTGKNYLYFIPLQEIALTNNAITQNPGWGN